MSSGVIETIDIIEPWLYATLSDDPELAGLVGDRVSGTLSSVPLKPPYVTFSLQDPLDVIGIGGVRISTDNLYVVKAVGQTGSWADVRPIASRIDYLLHRPTATMTSGAGSLTCVREKTAQMVEVDDGLQYRHLGGIYRIRASADD